MGENGIQIMGLSLPVFLGIVAVAVVLFIVFLLRSIKKATASIMNEMEGGDGAKALLQTGTPAKAKITDIEMGGSVITIGVDRRIQVVLSLQIMPDGMAPYAAVLTPYISELHIPQFQPGKLVQVRYNPADPHQLAFEKVLSDI